MKKYYEKDLLKMGLDKDTISNIIWTILDNCWEEQTSIEKYVIVKENGYINNKYLNEESIKGITEEGLKAFSEIQSNIIEEVKEELTEKYNEYLKEVNIFEKIKNNL